MAKPPPPKPEAQDFPALDGDHLSRQCGQLLSLALNGKEIRDRHVTHLRHLLWHGCVDSAIAILAAIHSEDVKNQKKKISGLRGSRVRVR